MRTVEIKKTKVFDLNRKAFDLGKYRVLANQGSTRSGKTYSISQLLALYIANKEKVTISVVSPSLPHLKRGARRDILEILEKSGLYSDEAFNKTDNIYNFPNGSYIEFFGAEDSGKVRDQDGTFCISMRRICFPFRYTPNWPSEQNGLSFWISTRWTKRVGFMM